MRKTILYIAMSLDGYIAKADGDVTWLEDCVSPQDGTSIPELMERIDTILMGRRTYDQITTELMPNAWPYEQQHTYVFTHKQYRDNPHCTFADESVHARIQTLRQQQGKDIWICGGADLIHQCLQDEMIDKIWVTMMPVLLGEGIPLFQSGEPFQAFQLLDVKRYGTLVDLIYEKTS